MAGGTAGEPEDEVDEQAGEELIKAYYPALLGSADAARSMAQNGYTIAGAVAAAIVAAGVFGDFTSAATPVKWLGGLALGLWLLAALAYIHAVAGSVEWPTGDAENLAKFTKAIVEFATTARKEVERRAALAQLLTSAAVIVTGAALLAAAVEPHRSTAVSANVLLSPSGVTAVSKLCSTHGNVIRGSVEPEALGRTTITVTMKAGGCGEGEATLHLLGKDVLAIAKGGKIAQEASVPVRVQVELTPRGRVLLSRRLGRHCRIDDLKGTIVAGPPSAPTVLVPARPDCRRLRVRVTHGLGYVLYLASSS